MNISEIIAHLETIAPPAFQESYDNAGLLTGLPSWQCTGALITLDATEEVILEAKGSNCNLVIAHHPIIFKGLKKINGRNYVERAVIAAIKNDIAIYAIHTNLDNVIQGVSGKMAALLDLQQVRILSYRQDTLKKLFTFVPIESAEAVRKAVFDAGGGNIGQYSQCSFNMDGLGTFMAKEGADPYIGEIGKPTTAREMKIEIIFPAYLEGNIVQAMLEAHPYEEVAYDVVALSNTYQYAGSGVLGELAEPMDEKAFMARLKEVFGLAMVRHTPLLNRPVHRVALCGGAGSFLIANALNAGADMYVTADVKYHEFFDAEGRMVIADIGHFESERFTVDLLHEILVQKFPTFAVLKSGVQTNPVNYF
ncbi:MAG TPA: Nif3-like dinuclear metal center hexameric protein [Chitinophagaceae bacterium]|nr:Nif3-like dinuclear metal center hexameric protein [Chitinophagaceae bacterium]